MGGKDHFPKKRSSGDAALDNADDIANTIVSPMKTVAQEEVDETDGNINVRRKLNIGYQESQNSELEGTKPCTKVIDVPTHHHKS